jgi:hypothetical protein
VQHKAAAEEDTENIEDRAMQSSFAQSARVQQMHLPQKRNWIGILKKGTRSMSVHLVALFLW